MKSGLLRQIVVPSLLGWSVLLGCASSQPKPEEKPAAAKPAAAETPAPAAQTPAPVADAFRAKPPSPGPAPEFHAPIPKELRLKNGLRVYLIERHEIPLVTVMLAVDAGEDTEPAGKSGLSSLALSLLEEGTATRDAAAVARGFEDLAARYHSQTDADGSSIGVTALASTLDPVLELFADVALHPAFRAADVERLRQQRLGQISQALDDPQSVGQNVLSRAVFGAQHPWGFPSEGTVKSVKSLTRADLVGWHKSWFQPSHAALFVVGDVAEPALLATLEQRFGGWKDSARPKPVVQKLPAHGERLIYLVDKADAPQSQIWVGEVGVSSTSPDVFPVRVMNQILGGSFNSRLNGNLRTAHAYSYGVFSYFDTHREAGPFIAAGGVVSDKTVEALGEFVSELRKMKGGEVSPEELADAKDGLMRAIPALFASGETTAGAYARAWIHGLPSDYYAQYQQRVGAVSREDVAKAARERLHPDEMAIVVVGPRKAIEDKLAGMKLGKVVVRGPDAEPLPAKGQSSSR